MHETPSDRIQDIFEKQHSFFNSQQTKSLKFRKEMLKKFKIIIKEHENEILEALWNDLHKSPEEAFLTEIGIIYSEIDYQIRHLQSWAAPEKVSTPLVLLPSSGQIIREPLGNALIISPWNYPFQLAVNPLIGAISAGNCAIVKPSPDAIHTALIIEKIISLTFDSRHVACIQGGRETNENLFNFPFDVVMFTGSSKVGKIFMQNFATHLSKMILELGGKSPCIVNEDANVKIAARRIIWGKTINAGQTCIAPDYLMVHKNVKHHLTTAMQSELEKMFGKNIQTSEKYGRMVNDQAFNRVYSYLNDGKIIFGGKTDKLTRFIEPTLLEVSDMNSEVMQREIFGPVLPIISFTEPEEAIAFVRSRPKPLAFYYFGKYSESKKVLAQITSGGACINDTLIHVAHHKIPFGGVGNSGLGHYHGKFSFDAFSHQRAVVNTPTWIDLPMKYAPYKYFEWIKKMF